MEPYPFEIVKRFLGIAGDTFEVVLCEELRFLLRLGHVSHSGALREKRSGKCEEGQGVLRLVGKL
jgi:hypothetical protein